MAAETDEPAALGNARDAAALEQFAGTVPLDAARQAQLHARAERVVNELAALDPNSPEFGRKISQLTRMGQREIAAAAEQSNYFLTRPMRALNSESSVGADLGALRRSVEDLDPGQRGDLLAPKKWLGLFKFGSRLRDYFDSYQSAQSHIAALLMRLADGKNELLRDNAAIEIEREALWRAMGRLEQWIFISKALDRGIAEKAEALQRDHPAQARALREHALFYVRQRTTDLLTQMAVSMQGYLALDMVRKNNVELMQGVDRASTTTVSALRTAVTVAQALTQQKLVLQQIQALNTTTARVVDAAASSLREQSRQVQQQAASPGLPLETLKRAFQNVYSTMDAIDAGKAAALSQLKATVATLSSEVEQARGRLALSEGTGQGGGAPEPLRLTD